MSIKSIWKSINRTEPEKTFVKAGIMDDDGELTVEGKDLFIEYLFKQNAVSFKKDVADEIIKENEKENA